MSTKTYAYHRPSAAGIASIATLRKAFTELHDTIESLAPDSEERTVALKELQTASMWAIKSVVCNDPESTIAE